MVYCESKAATIDYGDKGVGANCWEGRGGGMKAIRVSPPPPFTPSSLTEFSERPSLRVCHRRHIDLPETLGVVLHCHPGNPRINSMRRLNASVGHMLLLTYDVIE